MPSVNQDSSWPPRWLTPVSDEAIARGDGEYAIEFAEAFGTIGKDGIAVVNVAHDVFPKLDPCPKEGRDIFQFIISMWSIKEVRDKLPPQIHSWIEEILKYKSISYSDVSQKMKHSGWSYLVVGDAKFSHPVMHPISILRQLASLSPSIVSLF